MKKSIVALLLAGTMLLSGCARLLDREFSSVTPHNSAPVTEGDPSILRADNYQELVNALVYFITLGMEQGTVRLYTDWDNVEQQLEKACLEVVKEDPLGAYSVEFIKYAVSPLVPYTEARVNINYRRTREQVASIASVTGTTAIRSELKEALAAFAPECVLRISSFDQDETFIRSLARQAFYDSPISALDVPDLEVNIYPATGRQRIVELSMTYHLDVNTLRERRERLAHAISAMGRTIPLGKMDTYLRSAAQTLLGSVHYSSDGGTTAWDAITTKKVNSEGMALVFSALCQQLQLPCQVVQGTRNDAPHFWNVVSTSHGWRHLDLTQTDYTLMLDTQAADSGYDWNRYRTPKCVPPAAAP